MEDSKTEITNSTREALSAILKEHIALQERVDAQELQALIKPIKNANSIFLIGMGRSGLMMQAAAMRLMHLGFEAYVVGETTTPAIKKGDLLIAGSGSGTTATVIRAATKAFDLGAEVACFTTDSNSELAELSTYRVIIPAAEKQEHNNSISEQYAGSLFEQGFLLVFDALIQSLWKLDGSSAETLYKRHSNLE
ncbi:6-phospho-3-hexuloisomerase [Leeuwenhoekiella parthenopeia]|uniref:6-phospho-3-hexuloisomerase n=1 Tax=Leeuwenhoekiella parthenopeia TaxID=2890320 RepID=A0ABS8GSZ6_9FLAO|nr:6-phospho-3-hexuloisomerase [Leeuwenhoekiella parthenopeia]MCC4213087.1 6-phospho-3-hexuloisomerase [Leeuwenhoekiella parthenopeia]